MDQTQKPSNKWICYSLEELFYAIETELGNGYAKFSINAACRDDVDYDCYELISND